MSVTKLKTVGSWPPALRNGSAEPARIRGRVITGLLTGPSEERDGLTGGDAHSEPPPVAEDRRKERAG
jgi:hypothetical protein